MDLSKKFNLIRELGRRNSTLRGDVVKECVSTLHDSYESSTVAALLGKIKYTENLDALDVKSIGIRKLINTMEFNDPSYIWTHYFADVGRAIAIGEREYFKNTVMNSVNPIPDTIDGNSPNFKIISQQIEDLLQSGKRPNTLLVPFQLKINMFQELSEKMEFHGCQGETITLVDTKLRIIDLNIHAPINHFVVFDSNAGVWTYVLDPDKKQKLLVAIGESADRLDLVEYWVEVLTKYEILDPVAIRVIPVISKAKPSATDKN